MEALEEITDYASQGRASGRYYTALFYTVGSPTVTLFGQNGECVEIPLPLWARDMEGAVVYANEWFINKETNPVKS